MLEETEWACLFVSICVCSRACACLSVCACMCLAAPLRCTTRTVGRGSTSPAMPSCFRTIGCVRARVGAGRAGQGTPACGWAVGGRGARIRVRMQSISTCSFFLLASAYLDSMCVCVPLQGDMPAARCVMELQLPPPALMRRAGARTYSFAYLLLCVCVRMRMRSWADNVKPRRHAILSRFECIESCAGAELHA